MFDIDLFNREKQLVGFILAIQATTHSLVSSSFLSCIDTWAGSVSLS